MDSAGSVNFRADFPPTYRKIIYGHWDHILYDREHLFEELTPDEQARIIDEIQYSREPNRKEDAEA